MPQSSNNRRSAAGQRLSRAILAIVVVVLGLGMMLARPGLALAGGGGGEGGGNYSAGNEGK